MLADYTITPPQDGDKAFVCDSWRRSLQDAPAYAAMPTRAYLAFARPLIKAFLGDSHTQLQLAPGVRLYVARDRERPRYIHGWALVCLRDERSTLLYCFVKKEHRRQGVAQELLAHACEDTGEPLTHYGLRTRFDALWHDYGLEYLPAQRLEVAA